MAQKGKALTVSALAEVRTRTEGAEERPLDLVNLLTRVDKLLREGEIERALDTVARSGVKSPWASCAVGVCQLRLGNAKVAVDVFRALVLASGGLVSRRDVPDVFKTNYATALLLSGNLSGGLQALHEVGDALHPAAVKLHQAIRRWRNGLTFWQKVNWWMGGQPDHPFTLDFPPGDLE